MLTLTAQSTGVVMTLDEWHTYLLVLVALVVGLVVWFFIQRFVRKRIEAHVRSIEEHGIEINDLKRMQKTGLLTEDELKLVRQAMARQFLTDQDQTEAKRAGGKAGFDALALLRIEAERADRELEERRRQGLSAPPPSSGPAPRPGADAMPPAAAAPPPPQAEAPPPLPAALQPMTTLSDIELEDLCNAGLLSPDDMERIQQHRERSA
ncbi:MAG: hypothetical protein RLY93_01105 [Sumerlaeia bacterium]